MRTPLVVAVVWFAAGVAVGLQRPIPPWGGPFLVLAAAGGAAVAAWLAWGGTVPARIHRGASRPTAIVLGLLVCAGALLGISARTSAHRSCVAWLPEDRATEVVGVVTRAVERPGAGSMALRIRIDSVRTGGRSLRCGSEVPARWNGSGSRPAEGVTITAADQAPLTAGAMVRASGRWWSPPGARPGLVRPGALLLDTLGVVDAGRAARRGGPGIVVRMRDAASARIDVVFPRHAPLVASLLLAQRDALDPEVKERYARAGLSHLLAISGLHVGLVAGILLLLAGAIRAGRHPAALAAAGTVAYVAFLGAPDSAARAALQIVLVLAARSQQRPTRSEALMGAAALLLLAVDPASLARPGFQLSFAGVVGILALRRPILARLGGLARWRPGGAAIGRWLADALATSVAATLATGPIVAWHFGRVAPVGIVANLAAIPVLTAAVPALAVALTVGAIWLPAGHFIAGGAELLLDILDRTATVAASVPYGTVAVLPTSAAALTAALAIGYGATRRLGRVRGRVRGVAWASVAGAVLVVAPLRPAGDRVELHLIDVGQGDAIGIRSPGGRWLLVDAGLARNDYDAGAARVVPYLASRGVRRIHGLVITHADADHMGGAATVIRALRPRWAGGPPFVAGKGQYLALLNEVRSAGIPWVAVRRGMEVEMDGMTVAFLFPDVGDVAVEDANDASVVLRVEYGEFAALLTGDAPATVEAHLVQRMGVGLDSDVLKVGHHGSTTSTTPQLLEATGARTALISAGRGNGYGHPHGPVLARLRQHGVAVYRTDLHGSVVVRSGADGRVRVETERDGNHGGGDRR